jgi:hypothetical protein
MVDHPITKIKGFLERRGEGMEKGKLIAGLVRGKRANQKAGPY